MPIASIGIVLHSSVRCKGADIFIVTIVTRIDWRNIRYTIDVRTRNKCSMRSLIACLRYIVVVNATVSNIRDALWNSLTVQKTSLQHLRSYKMEKVLLDVPNLYLKKCNNNKQYSNPKMKIFRNFLCYFYYMVYKSLENIGLKTTKLILNKSDTLACSYRVGEVLFATSQVRYVTRIVSREATFIVALRRIRMIYGVSQAIELFCIFSRR